MGKSYTPTFHAYYRDNVNPKVWKDIGWTVKGRPTDAKAEDFRKTLNKSFDIGGCNYHVSEAAGVVVHVIEVKVVRQSPREIVAVAKAPMFEAF